jgi:hypothetical protein
MIVKITEEDDFTSELGYQKVRNEIATKPNVVISCPCHARADPHGKASIVGTLRAGEDYESIINSSASCLIVLFGCSKNQGQCPLCLSGHANAIIGTNQKSSGSLRNIS